MDRDGLLKRDWLDIEKYQSRLQICEPSRPPTMYLKADTLLDTNPRVQPMTWPDRISVFHKLRSRPDAATESIILDVMILSETKQRPAARCLEDVVVYDYPASKKTTLPGFLLDQFQQTFDLQEAAKAENGKKINRLLDRVRDLELESWDRPDAQEDFGTSRS